MLRRIAFCLALVGGLGWMWALIGNVAMRDASAQTVSPLPLPLPMPAPFTGTLVLSNSVTAIGDSVMLGAARELSKTIVGIHVDAAKSRQMSEAVRILTTRQISGTLDDVVIMHIGNNGPITATLFDAMMQQLRATKLVIIVNLKVGRSWEAVNNVVLADGVKRYPNAVLLDWHELISANTELLAADGTHLGAKSAKLYTSMIVEALMHSHPTPTSSTKVAATPESWPASRLPR